MTKTENRKPTWEDGSEVVSPVIDKLEEGFHERVREVFDADSDGDYPVQIIVIDRTKHGSFHFIPSRNDVGKDELMDELDNALTNLAIATEEVNRCRRLMRFFNE